METKSLIFVLFINNIAYVLGIYYTPRHPQLTTNTLKSKH